MKEGNLFKKNDDGSYEATTQVSIGQPGGGIFTLRPGMKFRPGDLVGGVKLEVLLDVKLQVPEGADDTGKSSSGPATSASSSGSPTEPAPKV